MKSKKIMAGLMTFCLSLSATATPMLSYPKDISAANAALETYTDSAIGTLEYYNHGDSIVISSEIEGLPITVIGASSFQKCSKLKSIVIPDTATSISSSAFSKLTKLTDVTIPDRVTEIADIAFFG